MDAILDGFNMAINASNNVFGNEFTLRYVSRIDKHTFVAEATDAITGKRVIIRGGIDALLRMNVRKALQSAT